MDRVLIDHLIFDDMLHFELFCLYHIWRRTVRYIHKTIGDDGKKRNYCCCFFEYCDNHLQMRVSDIEDSDENHIHSMCFSHRNLIYKIVTLKRET
jgi:hypothetical protein